MRRAHKKVIYDVASILLQANEAYHHANDASDRSLKPLIENYFDEICICHDMRSIWLRFMYHA